MPRIGGQLIGQIARRAPLAALALILASASLATARQVGANGPAELPLEEPAAPVTVAPSPAVSASGLDGGAASAPITPATESRSLGAANPGTPRVNETGVVDREPVRAIGRPESDGFGYTRVLGALAAVVGLILLSRIVVTRYFPNLLRLGGVSSGDRPSGVIEILARYPLPGGGRGQQLIVLKFARRVLLAHQAGTTVRTLSEMTDPNEVAGLLARLEAGANEKSQHKFREALARFEGEHDVVLANQSRAGASLAATQTQIIDLTRTPSRGPGGVVRARRLLR